jgi:hypothetical protein
MDAPGILTLGSVRDPKSGLDPINLDLLIQIQEYKGDP